MDREKKRKSGKISKDGEKTKKREAHSFMQNGNLQIKRFCSGDFISSKRGSPGLSWEGKNRRGFAGPVHRI